MTIQHSGRLALRNATLADHEKVDRALSRFNLADANHYRNFLLIQAAAFLPIEAGIDAYDCSPFLPDWPDRRRSDALMSDLSDLGQPVALPVDIPTFDSVESVLGAVYVLEGSRLGGRLLARRVSEDWPSRFLNSGNSGLWRILIEKLDEILVSEDRKASAIISARLVFARFAAAATLSGIVA